MEELLTRHRKEKKELQGRIIQKKKSASKKTRKGVNDECDRLEHDLQQQHEHEISELDGDSVQQDTPELEDSLADNEPLTAVGHQNNGKKVSFSLNDLATPQTEPSQEKKPNRAKARLARRAAEQTRLAEEAEEEAKNLPDLQAQEKERMAVILKNRGLTEKEVRADGHCLYAATADQIRQQGQDVKVNSITSFTEDYRTVRHVAAGFIEENPDDFVPFLEEDLHVYLDKIRGTGEWGGQIELMALSKAYGVKIYVVHGDGNVIEIGEGVDGRNIWLAYYKHGYGLGEHYNSLRPSQT